MGIKKYNPEKWYWPDLDAKWWFKAWNHWANPLGNWLEPMPRPQGRVDDAYRSWRYKFFKALGFPTFGVWFFWFWRNFAANLGKHWVGIKPIGERYEDIDPQQSGWERVLVDQGGVSQFAYWKKGWIRLPYWTLKNLPWRLEAGIGWKGSGTLGSHFRRD